MAKLGYNLVHVSYTHYAFFIYLFYFFLLSSYIIYIHILIFSSGVSCPEFIRNNAYSKLDRRVKIDEKKIIYIVLR